MAENIHLEIVTPEKEVVSEDVQIVMAPGSQGEFGVLSGHTLFMTTLRTGDYPLYRRTGNRAICFCQWRICRSAAEQGNGAGRIV